MPLTRIDMRAGQPPDHRAAVADAVRQALHGALGVPMEERFQVITEPAPGSSIIDPGCLGIAGPPGRSSCRSCRTGGATPTAAGSREPIAELEVGRRVRVSSRKR